MRIRTADEADWERIWPFFEQIVTAGETYAYPDPIDSATARGLWLEPAPWHVVVAVEGEGDDEVVLGSAKTGPNRPGRGSHIATASFMVSEAARGKGVGRALATYVLDWAAAQGFHGMQFNAVVETNTSAVRLWQDVGFEIVGTVPETFDHRRLGLVGLHVMYRPF